MEDVTRLVGSRSGKLGIEYACAGHTNDINAVADIADATGKPITVYAFLGSSPIRLFTGWTVETLLITKTAANCAGAASR